MGYGSTIGTGRIACRFVRSLRKPDGIGNRQALAGGSQTMPDDAMNLEQLLDRLGKAEPGRPRVSLGMVVEALGGRSFGPLLVLAGLILVSPLSGVPGLSTTMAMLVLIIAVQMLCHREHFWLPQWVLDRSLPRDRLDKALQCLLLFLLH